MNSAELQLFHVCLPDRDPDTWHEQRARTAQYAAEDLARALCAADPGNYREFQDGEAALVQAEGQTQRERFEVTVESIPHFSACKTGTCG
jgi:ABC-type Zn uptake system ZnuABC Zn-binding protein ZnuA